LVFAWRFIDFAMRKFECCAAQKFLNMRK
jgi:hypothetical protein